MEFLRYASEGLLQSLNEERVYSFLMDPEATPNDLRITLNHIARVYKNGGWEEKGWGPSFRVIPRPDSGRYADPTWPTQARAHFEELKRLFEAHTPYSERMKIFGTRATL